MMSEDEWEILFCECEFIDFLREHWDEIDNPRGLIDLLSRNEDLIEENENGEGACSEYIFWEYEVKVLPFSYKTEMWTGGHLPKMEDKTDMQFVYMYSKDNFGFEILRAMMSEIKVELKWTGRRSSELE